LNPKVLNTSFFNKSLKEQRLKFQGCKKIIDFLGHDPKTPNNIPGWHRFRLSFVLLKVTDKVRVTSLTHLIQLIY
jgi:hypothetical protein